MKPEYSKLSTGSDSPRQSVDDEERKALIPTEDRQHDAAQYDEEENVEAPPPSRSRRCVVFSVLFFSLLLLSLAIPLRNFFSVPRESDTKPQLKTQGLLNNGTHDFKKTAIIVSIDGLRCVSLNVVRPEIIV